MCVSNDIVARGFVMILSAMLASTSFAQGPVAWTPPSLPDGKTVVTDMSPAFITPPACAPKPAEAGYTVATASPTIDFLFFPGQTYKGGPWSGWGNGCVFAGKYYCGIGDHGFHSHVFEYDPATRQLRNLLDVSAFLKVPEGDYTPGKLHSFITPGKDGRLYFATTRSNPRADSVEHRYVGDWLLRLDPATGRAEILGHGVGGALSWPAGLLDPQRLIFYGGAQQDLTFLAYDTQTKRVRYLSAPNEGPSRVLLFSKTTGRVYYRTHEVKDGPLRRYDPATNTVTAITSGLDPRCASAETPQGFIYAIDWAGKLWRFDVNTEQSEEIAYAPIGKLTYTASLAVDPTGRYLYYNCGSHGGTKDEGTPMVQFDTMTRRKKVIAFLTPFYPETYGYTCDGTYSMVISDDGATLFTTWNGSRKGAKGFDVVAMTAIHIPKSERPSLSTP